MMDEEVQSEDWEDTHFTALRTADYYDLIELPSGSHIPVPIAKRLLGEAIIEAIPISRKVRNHTFYYCLICDEQQRSIDEFLRERHCKVGPQPTGYSFFRCKTHKPLSPDETKAKEATLVRLILGGLYKTLRYVRADW